MQYMTHCNLLIEKRLVSSDDSWLISVSLIHKVVCLGAEQNGLPVEYLKSLEAIQTNNYNGPTILDQIRTVMK